MYICPHCKQSELQVSFYQNKRRKTGLSILCKSCSTIYNATPARRAKRTWNTIKFRSGKQAGYELVEVRMSRQDFLEWAIPAYSEWMDKNPNQTPSLDRIDPAGHYELGNIRILERGHNSSLNRQNKNVHASINEAWCHKCESYLPAKDFWASKSNFNGLQHRCKTCQKEAIKKSRAAKTRLPQTNL